MRCASTRVLPEPAPARISTGPSVVVTARACSGFSRERSSGQPHPSRLPSTSRPVAAGRRVRSCGRGEVGEPGGVLRVRGLIGGANRPSRAAPRAPPARAAARLSRGSAGSSTASSGASGAAESAGQSKPSWNGSDTEQFYGRALISPFSPIDDSLYAPAVRPSEQQSGPIASAYVVLISSSGTGSRGKKARVGFPIRALRFAECSLSNPCPRRGRGRHRPRPAPCPGCR